VTGDAADAPAWAADPERLDPDDYPPGQPFARLLTWAPCPACALQAHLPVAQYLLRGLDCPRCGTPILPPPADAQAWLQQVLQAEDRFTERLG
jgi:hypothetical protein